MVRCSALRISCWMAVMPAPSLESFQSRVQARHGDRLSPDQWRHLAGAGLLGSYLQSARRTPLEPWIRGLAEDTGHHHIELALRNRWRGYVAELAGWPSSGWGRAVHWVDRLVPRRQAAKTVRHDAESLFDNAIVGRISANPALCGKGAG